MTRIKHQGAMLEIAAAVLILCAAFHHFSYVTADPDLWGHLKFGQAHWESGHLDRTDSYSFTACGREWINHEWLAELVFYFLFNIFQGSGLLFGKLILGLLVVAVVLATCKTRRSSPTVTACVMMAAIWVMKPGFMIRPQLFSFLFFSIYLLVFHLFFNRKINYLYCLPVTMVFWVNLHGGFLMGCVLIAIVVASESMAHIRFNNRVSDLKQLWVWGVITAAAVFLNPYGYHLIVFLYKSLSQPREITEWMPVSLHGTSYMHFKLSVIAVLAILFWRGRRNQGWEVAVLLFTCIFAMMHQRNIVFFAIAATPCLTAGFSEIVAVVVRRNEKLRMSHASRVFVCVVFTAAAVWHAVLGGRIYAASKGGIFVDPNKYPVSAVAFIKHNRFKGNLFVFFDWGEYALWKLYPDCRVSIDGRFRTVYPESVIRDHFIPGHKVGMWNQVIEKYPADIILFPRSPITAALMKAKNGWVYVYSDPLAFVFLRRNEKNRALISRFETSGFGYPVLDNPFAFP